MKPRVECEGVAMNKTSRDLSYPNMTQDEPERVKVEDVAPETMSQWLRRRACEPFHDQMVGAADEIDRLQSLLSVSEKEVERREREKLAAWMIANSYATGHGDTLMDLLGELNRQIRGRRYGQGRVGGHHHSTACSIWGDDGQGRAEGFGVELMCNCGALENYYRDKLTKAESERNSSQASLLRVAEDEREECAKVAEWARVTVPMTEGRSGTVTATRQAIAEAIRARTALSPHKET